MYVKLPERRRPFGERGNEGEDAEADGEEEP